MQSDLEILIQEAMYGVRSIYCFAVNDYVIITQYEFQRQEHCITNKVTYIHIKYNGWSHKYTPDQFCFNPTKMDKILFF